MPWTSPFPQDNSWGDREILQFLREIHRRLQFGTFTWDPGAIGSGVSVDTALAGDTFTALRAGMAVSITPPSSFDAGLAVTGWVATDGALTVRIVNGTAGSINPGSATWAYMGVMV